MGLPWRPSGFGLALLLRGHSFNPGSGTKIQYGVTHGQKKIKKDANFQVRVIPTVKLTLPPPSVASRPLAFGGSLCGVPSEPLCAFLRTLITVHDCVHICRLLELHLLPTLAP